MNLKIYANPSFLKLVWGNIKKGLNLIRKGHLFVFWDHFIYRLYSTSFSLGLERELKRKFIPPAAKISISIRLMKNGDADAILNHEELKKSFPKLVHKRQKLVEANIPNCYVAVADDDTPCYMQWLIGPQHNKRIQRFFGKAFPILNKDEALIESAFANPAFRGMGVMPEAMSKIAAKADKLGVQRVITFVDIENIPSLKGCRRAGFSPYILKKSRWRLFRHQVSYREIPDKTLSEYFRNTGGQGEHTAVKELTS